MIHGWDFTIINFFAARNKYGVFSFFRNPGKAVEGFSFFDPGWNQHQKKYILQDLNFFSAWPFIFFPYYLFRVKLKKFLSDHFCRPLI